MKQFIFLSGSQNKFDKVCGLSFTFSASGDSLGSYLDHFESLISKYETKGNGFCPTESDEMQTELREAEGDLP